MVLLECFPIQNFIFTQLNSVFEGFSACRIVAREFLNACLLNDFEAVNDGSNCNEEDSLKGECYTFGISLIDESSQDLSGFYSHSDTFTDLSSNSNLLKPYSCLIATKEVAMKVLCINVDTVAILGTEYFDSSQMSFVDYSLLDLISLTAPYRKECFVFCRAPKEQSLSKFLFDSIPIESHLHLMLHDALLGEICCTRTITNKQEAVEFLGYSFLYKRLSKNPTYYALGNSSISEFLSDLVETTVEQLEGAFCKVVEEFEIAPRTLGMISSFYSIPWNDVELFLQTLQKASRKSPASLIELLAAASLWDSNAVLPQVRDEEEQESLRLLNSQIPSKFAASTNFWDSHVKVAILLQCHLSRIPLPSALKKDLNSCIQVLYNLSLALCDVATGSGCGVDLCICCMEFSQMICQALWDTEPNVKQIPFLTCTQVDSVYEFLDLPAKEQILSSLSPSQRKEAEAFCRTYPSISVDLERSDNLLIVGLSRDNYAEDQDSIVHSAYLPFPKSEGWWIMVTSEVEGKNELIWIKKVTFASKFQVSVDVSQAESGKIFLFSDSYIGCDQEFDF